MGVSAFSIIRNGIKFEYPFLESIQSLLPIVDEFVLNVGKSEDHTLQAIQDLQSNPHFSKLKIIESHWPIQDALKMKSGQILSEQTNLALNHCYNDLCFYLQADEVIHEKDYPWLLRTFDETQSNARVHGAVLNYVHFYGNYEIIQYTKSAYRREIRLIKKSSGAKSIGDAQSFLLPNSQKLRVLHSPASVFHYGWVRSPQAMLEKTFFLDELYHGKNKTAIPHSGTNYVYKRFWGLKKFKGEHPSVMRSRIKNRNWHWDWEKSSFVFSFKKDFKKILIDAFEYLTGIRLFEFKNYIIQSTVPVRAALVLSTYNQARELDACLRSLWNQSTTSFDVFIADDGSGSETQQVIQLQKQKWKNRLKHYWHPDSGYNKAKIHNEVFRNILQYPVVICADGDTLMHPQFVSDHLAIHSKKINTLFMGRRVELNAKESSYLLERFSPFRRLKVAWKSKHLFRFIRIQNPWLRKILNRDNVIDLMGSNFSVSTELLFKVNGFDETLQSYWGEDGDLFIRLRNSGANILGSKSIALQYHLDHPRREPDPKNVARYKNSLNDFQYFRCELGIDQSQNK